MERNGLREEENETIKNGLVSFGLGCLLFSEQMQQKGKKNKMVISWAWAILNSTKVHSSLAYVINVSFRHNLTHHWNPNKFLICFWFFSFIVLFLFLVFFFFVNLKPRIYVVVVIVVGFYCCCSILHVLYWNRSKSSTASVGICVFGIDMAEMLVALLRKFVCLFVVVCIYFSRLNILELNISQISPSYKWMLLRKRS